VEIFGVFTQSNLLYLPVMRRAMIVPARPHASFKLRSVRDGD
jgi:hypothetical protein